MGIFSLIMFLYGEFFAKDSSLGYQKSTASFQEKSLAQRRRIFLRVEIPRTADSEPFQSQLIDKK